MSGKVLATVAIVAVIAAAGLAYFDVTGWGWFIVVAIVAMIAS